MWNLRVSRKCRGNLLPLSRVQGCFNQYCAIASVPGGPGDAAPDVDFTAEPPKSQKSKAHGLFEVALFGQGHLPSSAGIRLEEGAKESISCPTSRHEDLPWRGVPQSMMNGPSGVVGGGGKGDMRCEFVK